MLKYLKSVEEIIGGNGSSLLEVLRNREGHVLLEVDGGPGAQLGRNSRAEGRTKFFRNRKIDRHHFNLKQNLDK